ncbi:MULTISPECIES: hypothetical protein [unclassified Modicisalibacter]|uniref:hypothetical protein n=1 Tax=unclassified Modicisalibacter TaxID=2679913 RepID=UPI001CCFB7F9|nr:MULTISPECIES: hypothetical protein [unclassified Modicisalibacter]MBZ9556808.1 hypothetical protein [Modicisalibacter sp. R2A 31.J]MBZ9574722.1 hypothetical protein [Modicisalibacter sp. MOD 31.J]
MSRASIFDRLSRRPPSVEPVESPSAARGDYDPDRLRLIDGVALTASGFVGGGGVPEARSPNLSGSLRGADGFRLPVHEIVDVMPVEEPRLKRVEAKALRLHELVQTLMVEALMMLETLPEDAAFDVVLSAPIRSAEAAGIVVEHLRGAIADTQYAACLGEVRHLRHGDDPHAALSLAERDGMPYVLWISADSLLNEADVTALGERGVLVRASHGAGLRPGEAVSALLIQRLLPEPGAFDDGWRLDRGYAGEHAPRGSRRDHDKRRALLASLDAAWPCSPAAGSKGEKGDEDEGRDTSQDIAGAAPSRLVIDTIGLPGRAVEVASALTERWPELDMIEDGIGIDDVCGWPGEALTALALVLAIAGLEAREHALVLSLEAETRTRLWPLRSYAAEIA